MSLNQLGMKFSSSSSSLRGGSNNIQSPPTRPDPHKKAMIAAKQQFITTNSFLSSSETDLSTSTENLSLEQRHVLRNTPRIEPQGQENFEENLPISNENKYATRYGSNNRSLSEARNPMFIQTTVTNTPSNRNSIKESNSSRSSMDVSSCSYNTLIIHNDENMYPSAAAASVIKKDRPRSCGEQGVQEISQIPDDYLKKSQVLKHLANEMKIPTKPRSTDMRESRASEGKNIKEKQKLNLIMEDLEFPNRIKSKSLPDLSKMIDSEMGLVESLAKENALLKQQILMNGMKVAKTKQLEGEVANIYRVYEELVQSCNRREKLEKMARMRLQENLQKVQALNRALQAKVDLFQTPMMTPSENQLIEPLLNQYKELLERKERQDIELTAQQATLQEQRRHIGILDAALNNAQSQCRHLEEELRKKQIYIERLTQVLASQSKQNDRMRVDFEAELSKDSNRSGSSTSSEKKWQLDEKNSQMMRLESEQRNFKEQTVTPNSSKLSLDKKQETEKIIAEAKQDKMRYIEEAHCAQRKVSDLQSHLKNLESKMAEKDAFIRALKSQKKCSSFDSYNLSADSYGLNSHLFNTPNYNSTNTNYNAGSTAANIALLDASSYVDSSSSTNFNSGISAMLVPGGSYDQSTSSSYNPNQLQSMSIAGAYSHSPNSSNYSASFDPNLNFIVQNSPAFNISSSSFDNKYEEKQINEPISKVSQLPMQIMPNQNYASAVAVAHNNASKLLIDSSMNYKYNRSILDGVQDSSPNSSSSRNESETFY